MRFKKTISALIPLIMSAEIMGNTALTASAVTTTSVTATSTAPVTTTVLTKAEPSIMLGVDKDMFKGEQYAIDTHGNNLTFSSDNPNVAVVSADGLIEAVGLGNATVLAVNANNDAVQINVKVSEAIPGLVLGDINGDGVIDSRDATLLLSYYAQTSTGYNGSVEQFMTDLVPVVTSAKAVGPHTDAASETTAVNTTTQNTAPPAETTSANTEIGNYISRTDSIYSLWIDIGKDCNYVFNDQFLKVTFKVKEGIPSKDYAVRINPDLSNIDGYTVEPDKIIGGYIRVGGESIEPTDVSSENGFVVYGSNIACNQGDTVDYYINLKNNPGLAATLLWIYYDANAMDLISVMPAGEFIDVSKTGEFQIGRRKGD